MSQDNKKSFVMYQGDGSNNVFSVPMTKGKYGTISVAFVRRGLDQYEYNPTTWGLNGGLFAWDLSGTKVYTDTATPAIGATIYDQYGVDTGDTVTAVGGATITVNTNVYTRDTLHDVDENTVLTWTGDTLQIGDYIVIERTTTRTQPFEFQNNQKHIEKSDDNLERQIQEVADKVDNALLVDPTHTIDSNKMNPVEWMRTILRSVDKSVRGFRYLNGWLDYSLDDPNVADVDKTWTHLLNTDNVRSIRERSTIVDGVTLYYTEYLSEDGVWRAFADSPASVNTKVDKAGDTMTGVLKMRASESFKCAIAPSWDGVGFFKLNDNDSVTLMASMEEIDGLTPATNNKYNIGKSAYRWKDLYLSGKAYMSVINNGYDLLVPARSGTLATKEEVDLAANSGDQLTEKGVWYAKMYSATVAPSAEDGTNYADFSQTDNQGNPIIVIYKRQNGAWVQDQTITPPAEYNGYVPVTSKIWDIVEQSGQQGGKVLWSHNQKTFTPSPLIISLEDIEITGDSTVVMPQNPSSSQIVNKDYVDNAITNGGTGRNVGDIFLTMRNDNELNGAVECDGSSYNTTDFTGAQSIGQLLSAGKVPYVSLSAYADEITAKGWCDKFGWDGVGTTAFKVPTLNAYIWQKLNMAVVGNGNNTVYTDGTNDCVFNPYFGSSNNGIFVDKNSSHINVANGTSMGGGTNIAEHLAIGLSTDKTKSNVLTDTTDDICDERVMVQLAISATDEALETCTSVLADVAANTAAIAGADYVVESQLPTAANNYIWYRKYKSGWVEQGGRDATGTGTKTINLPVTMADEYYTVTTATVSNTATHNATVLDPTTTSFKAIKQNSVCYWEVKGMAAN